MQPDLPTVQEGDVHVSAHNLERSRINQNMHDLGDLPQLLTSTKDSIVGAINEIVINYPSGGGGGGGGASVDPATESVAGIAPLATSSEVDAGTSDSKIVTPYKLKAALGDRNVDLLALYNAAKA